MVVLLGVVFVHKKYVHLVASTITSSTATLGSTPLLYMLQFCSSSFSSTMRVDILLPCDPPSLSSPSLQNQRHGTAVESLSLSLCLSSP